METTNIIASYIPLDAARITIDYLTPEYAYNARVLCAYGGLVEQCLAATNINLGLEGACEGYHKYLIYEFLRMGARKDNVSTEVACYFGDEQLIGNMRYISKDRRDLNKYLEKSCEGGHWNIAAKMIKKGAQLVYGMRGACKGGHLRLVNNLLRRGVDAELSLAIACEYDNIDIVRRLCSIQFKDVLNTPLCAASEKGHEEIVFHLLTCGAKNTNDALRNASRRGHYSLVTRLLNTTYKFDLNSALVSACSSNQEKIIHLLIEHGADDFKEALISASQRGHLHIIKTFLEKAKDHVNACLVHAATYSHDDVCKFLLENGATSINDALIAACDVEDNAPVIFLLLEAGGTAFKIAYISIRNSRYSSDGEDVLKTSSMDPEEMLLLSTEYGDIESVDYAISCGAKNINDAFSIACAEGYEYMFEMLIEHGATECSCDESFDEHI